MATKKSVSFKYRLKLRLTLFSEKKTINQSVENEWVDESKITSSKTVPISMIQPTPNQTASLLYNPLRFRTDKRK
jgi:hypothetical protein